MTKEELTIKILELRLKQALAQRDILLWEFEIQKLSVELEEKEKENA